MTDIKLLKNKIIFDGQSDNETVDLIRSNLARSKDFKTVEYKDGYAEFERIGNAKDLKFAPTLSTLTINFDSHITKVVVTEQGLEWTTSGQANDVSVSTSGGANNWTFTVTLADGYVIDTVTPNDNGESTAIISNITTSTFVSDMAGGGDATMELTITSKLAPYRFKHYRNPESLGGTPLNIVYSDTAPSDTSKLWIKSSVPSEITFMKDADLIFDAVTSSGTLPTKAYQKAAAAVGTKIYLFGGYNSSTSGAVYITSIKMFDTITNSISTLSAVLPTKAYGISAVTVGTKIYLFGGYTGSAYLNTINVFDTVNNTISTLSTTLYKGDYGIAAAAVGTKIYLFGGSMSDTISVFDTENNSISTLSTKLPNVIGGAAAIPTNNKIYLFGGGKSIVSLLNTIYVFDVESSSLTLLTASLPAKTMDIAAGLVGTKIYLFGGYTGSSLNTIQMFDTVTNTISTLSKTLPQQLDGIAIATVKNKIYLFGGRQEGTTNKYFDTIYNVNFTISLSANNIFVKESLTQNLFDLMPTPTRVEIGIDKVYKGNASNNAELCDAYLHDGTNWVNVNTGENYVKPTPSKSVTINVTNYSNADDTIIINGGEPIEASTLYYANETFNDVTSLIINKQSGDVCYYIINGEQKDFANYGENDLTDELQTGSNTLELYFDD